MKICDTEALKGNSGKSSQSSFVGAIPKDLGESALLVEGYGNYRLDTLRQLLIADFHFSLMNAMSMANVRTVIPSIQDISSHIEVVLWKDTGKPGWYNLRLNITPLDIKVKLPRNGPKPSIKPKSKNTKKK